MKPVFLALLLLTIGSASCKKNAYPNNPPSTDTNITRHPGPESGHASSESYAYRSRLYAGELVVTESGDQYHELKTQDTFEVIEMPHYNIIQFRGYGLQQFAFTGAEIYSLISSQNSQSSYRFTLKNDSLYAESWRVTGMESFNSMFKGKKLD